MGSSFLQWFQCLTFLMATTIAAIGNQTLLHSPVPLMRPCRLGNLGAQGGWGDAVYLKPFQDCEITYHKSTPECNVIFNFVIKYIFQSLNAIEYIRNAKALPGLTIFVPFCRVYTSDNISLFEVGSQVWNSGCILVRIFDGSLMS